MHEQMEMAREIIVQLTKVPMGVLGIGEGVGRISAASSVGEISTPLHQPRHAHDVFWW